MTEASVLAELKQTTVCKRNKVVNRVKLRTMKQDRGEPVRKFAGRVRSLAAVSSYSVKCSKESCGQDVSYTEAVIMDQIITGLADTEIQKDVLSHTDSDTMTLETLLKFIEGKESGLASQGLLSGGGGVSAVRPGQGQGKRNCRFCGEKHPWGKEHCKAADVTCQACGKTGHFIKVCRSSKKTQANFSSAVSDKIDIFPAESVEELNRGT